MTRLAFCAAAALAAGCSSQTDAPNVEPAPVVRVQERRAYEGTLPCADCTGIHTLLVLDPNTFRYQLVETYQGTNQPDSVFRTKGDWSTMRGSADDSTALVYRLDPRRGVNARHFVHVSDNEIRQLDHERAAIPSPQPYSLHRVPIPEDMAERRTMTLADSGRSVRLHPGEELTVRLPSRRSSGYGWVWIDTTGARLLRLAGPRHEPPAARSDADGSESFTFRAERLGRDTLALEYRRESEDRPARRFWLRVRVR